MGDCGSNESYGNNEDNGSNENNGVRTARVMMGVMRVEKICLVYWVFLIIFAP